MSVARFIADQRTRYRVPHTLTCALLGLSLSWFYTWLTRAGGPSAADGLHTRRDRRRDTVDRAVPAAFARARGLHGSPRLHADLRAAGWTVTKRTVAEAGASSGPGRPPDQAPQRADQARARPLRCSRACSGGTSPPPGRAAAGWVT